MEPKPTETPELPGSEGQDADLDVAPAHDLPVPLVATAYNPNPRQQLTVPVSGAPVPDLIAYYKIHQEPSVLINTSVVAVWEGQRMIRRAAVEELKTKFLVCATTLDYAML